VFEGLLYRIFGFGGIAQDPAGDPVRAIKFNAENGSEPALAFLGLRDRLGSSDLIYHMSLQKHDPRIVTLH
jgi:hypothetical protein